jgi:hypothetical protein
MRVCSAIFLGVLVSALFATAIPARGGEIFRRYQGTGSWNTSYYDPAWGMPMAVVVPPTAQWQTDYSWGVGGTRLTRIGPRYQWEYPAPESAYRSGDYLPAPPQPSDTQQFGVNYVRAPRR